MPAAGVARARVASAPASSANLGPGFDCLAVALELRVVVRVKPAEQLAISAEGEGSDLPTTPDHLAARVLRDVLGHDRAAVHVSSDIPVGRGLGSSAALAAAAAAAAGADDPLAVAARLDGHPENAAASVVGGLVAATTLDDDQPWAVSLPLDERAAFVVLVPEQGLSTEQARAALPDEVPHGDAARNLGRLGVLIGALADLSLFRPGLMDDRLHQPYRGSLMPQAGELIRGLEEAGALGAAWSGAGPSIVALCLQERASPVAEAGSELLRGAGIAGDARVLTPDMRGLQVAEA
ncbi:MAG: homoserine kinase [Actinobacteria bacterium]|nr:homoserine kinase [Actinomycetota bacterium]